LRLILFETFLDIECTDQKDLKCKVCIPLHIGKDSDELINHTKHSQISDLTLLIVLNKFVFYCFLLFCIILNLLCMIVFPLIIIEPIEL
jgi:hypothetical protein